jgi:hypothetical protein
MYRNLYANLKHSVCVNVLKRISLVLIIGIAVGTTQAAPGDLDTSFNRTGKFRGGFGGDDKANAVA